ncbi:MAG: NAD(P)-binding protein [Planctomycetota bacterium]
MSQTRRAIVAGFGPVGRLVCEGLADAGFEVTVIETNPQTVETQRRLGRRILAGDACDPAVLHEAGIASADTLVLTMPGEDDALRACRAAHAIRPEVFISARTNYLSKGMLAAKAGADHVVVEELVTAEAMRDAVVGHLCDDGRPNAKRLDR